MTLAQEEVFGPVGVTIGFDTDDEAIAIANVSRYGLNGGILSADAATAYEMSLRVRADFLPCWEVNCGPSSCGSWPSAGFS